MKPAVFHPQARMEYLQGLEYYSHIQAELGERFDQEIQRLVGIICSDPRRFSSIHPPVQRALSFDFPHSIVYLEQPERIWIIAVMHAKRHPGYWKSRLT